MSKRTTFAVSGGGVSGYYPDAAIGDLRAAWTLLGVWL